MPTIEVTEKEMKVLEKLRQEEKEKQEIMILVKATSACSNAIIKAEKVGLSYTEFLSLTEGHADCESLVEAIESLKIIPTNALYEMSHKLARYITKEFFELKNKEFQKEFKV